MKRVPWGIQFILFSFLSFFIFLDPLAIIFSVSFAAHENHFVGVLTPGTKRVSLNTGLFTYLTVRQLILLMLLRQNTKFLLP